MDEKKRPLHEKPLTKVDGWEMVSITAIIIFLYILVVIPLDNVRLTILFILHIAIQIYLLARKHYKGNYLSN